MKKKNRTDDFFGLGRATEAICKMLQGLFELIAAVAAILFVVVITPLGWMGMGIVLIILLIINS